MFTTTPLIILHFLLTDRPIKICARYVVQFRFDVCVRNEAEGKDVAMMPMLGYDIKSDPFKHCFTAFSLTPEKFQRNTETTTMSLDRRMRPIAGHLSDVQAKKNAKHVLCIVYVLSSTCRRSEAFQPSPSCLQLQRFQRRHAPCWTILDLPQDSDKPKEVVPDNYFFNISPGTEILHFQPWKKPQDKADPEMGSTISTPMTSTTLRARLGSDEPEDSIDGSSSTTSLLEKEQGKPQDDVPGDDALSTSEEEPSQSTYEDVGFFDKFYLVWRLGPVKTKVSDLLNQPIVEVVGALAVLLTSFLVAVSTLDNLSPVVYENLYQAILGINVIFAVEFLARWFSSKASFGKHFANPFVLVDLVVIVFPLLLSMEPTVAALAQSYLRPGLTSAVGSALINLRLLYVLRLQRVLQDLDTFRRFGDTLMIPTDQVQGWQLQLARVVLSLFTLLSVAAGLIYTAENAVNPNIDNYFDALYFGLTTLTTVGFGDIVPVTSAGKLIVEGSILVGVAVVPAQAAALVDALLARQKSNERDKQKAREQDQQEEETESSDNNMMIGALDSWMFNPTAVGASCSLADGPRESQDGQFTLLQTEQCTKCGASMHWSSAKYCWSCGYEF